jgi:hypothetical protein
MRASASDWLCKYVEIRPPMAGRCACLSSHCVVDSKRVVAETGCEEERRAERSRISCSSSGGRGVNKVGDFGVRVAGGARSSEVRAVLRRPVLAALVRTLLRAWEVVSLLEGGRREEREGYGGGCIALGLCRVRFCAAGGSEDCVCES